MLKNHIYIYSTQNWMPASSCLECSLIARVWLVSVLLWIERNEQGHRIIYTGKQYDIMTKPNPKSPQNRTKKLHGHVPKIAQVQRSPLFASGSSLAYT